MSNQNREELNYRFVAVYHLLEQKGEIIKNNREKSKSVFAKRIGTKNHIIDKYLSGERYITYDQAKELCAAYGISEEYMFQGVGKPFTKHLPSPDERLANILNVDNPNILFAKGVDAFSSDTVSVELWEDNERFRIPGVDGDLVAFNINGNSMSPTISNGDMVICSPLQTKNDVHENDIYAIVTNQSVWVKRIQRCFDHYGNWTHLKLLSDNHIEYDPILVDVNDVRSILKVTRRLTGLG